MASNTSFNSGIAISTATIKNTGILFSGGVLSRIERDSNGIETTKKIMQMRVKDNFKSANHIFNDFVLQVQGIKGAKELFIDPQSLTQTQITEIKQHLSSRLNGALLISSFSAKDIEDICLQKDKNIKFISDASRQNFDVVVEDRGNKNKSVSVLMSIDFNLISKGNVKDVLAEVSSFFNTIYNGFDGAVKKYENIHGSKDVNSNFYGQIKIMQSIEDELKNTISKITHITTNTDKDNTIQQERPKLNIFEDDSKNQHNKPQGLNATLNAKNQNTIDDNKDEGNKRFLFGFRLNLGVFNNNTTEPKIKQDERQKTDETKDKILNTEEKQLNKSKDGGYSK